MVMNKAMPMCSSRQSARRTGRAAPASADYVRLEKRLMLCDAREQKIRHIQRFESTAQNKFGHGAADDRRLLHAMARKTVHEQQIIQRFVRPQDGVVIEGV